MGQLKKIDLSEIKQDQHYIVVKTEDEYQTAEEAEVHSLSGDEIVTELREVFADDSSEDIYSMLLEFEKYIDEVEWTYNIFEIPVFKK